MCSKFPHARKVRTLNRQVACHSSTAALSSTNVLFPVTYADFARRRISAPMFLLSLSTQAFGPSGAIPASESFPPRAQYPRRLMPMTRQSPQSPGARFLTRFFAAIVAFILVTFALDFSWYHLRLAVPRLGSANSSVHRLRLLAIPDKGNKTEYQIDALHPEEDVPCTRTLFPQAGENPCWYVSRHANDPIPM